MYTELGRRVATRRVAVMEDFLRTFHLQWDGKDAELTAFATEPRASLGSFPKRSVKIGDRIHRKLKTLLNRLDKISKTILRYQAKLAASQRQD